MRKIRTLAILTLPILLTGCGLLFTDISIYNNPTPRIFNLGLSTEKINTGSNREVLISFDYYDPNGDVDLNSTLLFNFKSDLPIEPSFKARPDGVIQTSDHTKGTVSRTLHFDTSGVRDSGVIAIELFLYDSRQHQSNPLNASIEVTYQPGSGPIHFAACEVWFVDQPDGQPVSTYRMGREVFLRVQDFSLGVLEPDTLYASLSSPSEDWELRIPLYRTADPTIYTSRTGPRLGLNVPARSDETLLAFYRAYSDRQQICLSQAKIE